MEVILIAGIAENNVIGTEGDLPWHISEDLKRFKSLTTGNPVIMGRKTYESIIKRLGKPLPNRTNIVVTRQENYAVPDEVIVADSIDEAIKKASKFGDEIFIIGGEQIYEQTISIADKLEITKVHSKFEGDAFFPEIGNDWKEVKKEEKTTEEGIKYQFVTYEKAKNVENKKGVFIAFEGIDGCGKSTQIRKLVQHIFEKDKHFHVILTRNPYKDVSIRKVLHEDTDPYSKADKLADLYINDRRKQVDEIIVPNMKEGHFILTDRYKLSTISYQSAQGIVMQHLVDRQKDLPIPDMTFIIDVSAEVAKERMNKEDTKIRGKEHKFEANIEFAKKLRENYLKSAEIMKAKGEKIFVINGERTPDEIFEEVKDIFDREFSNQ